MTAPHFCLLYKEQKSLYFYWFSIYVRILMIWEIPNFGNFCALHIFCVEFLQKLESNKSGSFRRPWTLFFLGAEIYMAWLREKIRNICSAHLNFVICIFLTTWSNLRSPQPTQRWLRIMLITQHLEKYVFYFIVRFHDFLFIHALTVV